MLPDVYLPDDNKAADLQLANRARRASCARRSSCARICCRARPSARSRSSWRAGSRSCGPSTTSRILLPTNTELKVVVLSAIVMVQPRFPVPPDLVGSVQQYLPEMRKRMSPQRSSSSARSWALRPGRAGDPPRQVGPCSRRGLAPRRLRRVRRSRDLPPARCGRAGRDRMGRRSRTDPRARPVSISEDFFAARAQLGFSIDG